MSPTTTHPLPQKKFEQLAEHRESNSVSIYLSMDKKGQEQNQHLAQGRLKSCLKEVSNSLIERGMTEKEVSSCLQPGVDLLSEVELWRNPAEGLAIFMSPESGLNYYKIPESFDSSTYVGQRFYLSPLLPLYHDDGQYYLLELSQDYIKLFRASRFLFKDMNLQEVAPGRLEEAVGFDYEQKSLQFHSGRAGSAPNFHGHGAGKDEEQHEIISFFRKVDNGVIEKVNGQEDPLVLSCVDSLVPLYQKANTYNSLFDKHVSGDPEFKNDTQRHMESWEVVKPYFEQERKEKINKFNELQHTDKVSVKAESIIPAAINGRIDTLFMAKGTSLLGNYNPDTNTVDFAEFREADNTSLSDWAAMKTFLQGGKVYFLDTESMPYPDSPMNALMRY